jgi:hypothetical protein
LYASGTAAGAVLPESYTLPMKKRNMKKGLLFLASIASGVVLYAQEPADALRASWAVPGGTARSQAIGGAMGSLGGDISATFVNPAGLAFYKTGDFVLSPRFVFGKNKATYLGRTEKDNHSKALWGTTGFVSGIGSDNRNSSKNLAFSIAYNRSADFNSNVLYRGANNQNSYASRYLEDLANSGIKNDSASFMFPFGASLALNTYWINPVKDANGNVTGFQTASPIATGLVQQNEVRNRGGIDEFALGIGASLSDKVLFGGTLGVPVYHFRRTATFTEADATDNTTNNFNFAAVDESLRTSGVGINAKLGLIFKPVEYLRLGLAFHTPTMYSLKDQYEVTVTTDTEGAQGELSDYSLDYTNDQPSEFSYLMVTPYRAIVSASYVLREIEDVTKQKGFLTADIEYVNYKAASFQPDDDGTLSPEDEAYLKNLNRAIDAAYKPAFNFRVGGELKFTTLMVRAGAAYFGNPYRNINGERGSRLNLSGGLGYRHRGMFVDLTYVHAITKDVHFPYRLQMAPYAGANLKSGIGNVLATVGFKF